MHFQDNEVFAESATAVLPNPVWVQSFRGEATMINPCVRNLRDRYDLIGYWQL